MSVEGFLDQIRSHPAYRDQIVHVEHLPARDATYEDVPGGLSPALARSLKMRGVDRLYAHQAAAISLAREGASVVVSTATASGKTLCYNIPVLEAVMADPRARALYVFPTKALAQDQLRVLGDLSDGAGMGLRFGAFDGDTPAHHRAPLRKSAQVILTNPDMLSLGILPNHTSWAPFLAHLRYVVIDEAHAYRGIFGSHVANVLRRLRRLCDFYHSKPVFICCSATVANAGEHVERLTGVPVTVVNQDGAPRGPREFALWNPPVIDACGGRRSATSEASLLLAELVEAGIRNITFTKSRRAAEVVYLHARDTLEREAPEAVPLIAPYRAGYLPEERRRIEKALFGGRLLGVTSTTALELGVDVGQLDATVLTGYPGTLASVWQQAGRAGRGRDPALSILIAVADPLDQYLMRHPDEIFGKPVESALIDPANPYILPQHLLCAAYELPLSLADGSLFGVEAMTAALEGMTGQGQVRQVGDRWFYAGTGYPAQDVNIRSISGRYFSMLDRSQGSRLLETLEPTLAFLQAHPGAVYLHQGETYVVESLDLNAGNIYVRPAEVDYYTQAIDTTDLRIVKAIRSWTRGPTGATDAEKSVLACWGQVRVTAQVVGFRRKQTFTDEVLGVEPLGLPPQSYETMALWFDFPPGIHQRLAAEGLDLAGGLHALEHAAIAMLPLYAMCDRNDIGGLSTPAHPDTGAAQIFIYDAFPGGVGISEKGFAMLPDLWRATLRLLDECNCESGCPSCVQSPRCGNNNEPLDKRAAQVILTALLETAEACPGRPEGMAS